MSDPTGATRVTGAGTRTGTRTVRVRVPASSANLGPGFDALGLALAWYDEVTVETAPGGPALQIDVRGEGGREGKGDGEGGAAGAVPLDDRHLVFRALRAGFERLGAPMPGRVRLRCTNRIPHGRGLGSSSAAIVAGVVAARALVPDGPERLSDPAALALAAELEGHPDNVAACLLGGLTIAWSGDSGGTHAVRLEPAPVELTVYVPEHRVPTETARGLLPDTVPITDAARNAGRAALLIAALTGVADPGLLLPGSADRLHQRYRATAMPQSYDLVERLRAAGIAAVISGAGPTVLAFAPTSGDAPTGFAAHRLAIDRSGAVLGGAA